jgi:hypothetical protein
MATTSSATEGARDALQRAADHLADQALPAFEREFAPILARGPSFDPATDALDVALVPDAQRGIRDWEFAHLRVEGETTTCLHRSSFAEGVHLEGVSFVHPIGHPLEAARLLQGLFEGLVYLLTRPDPRAALQNPTLKVKLYDETTAQRSVV